MGAARVLLLIGVFVLTPLLSRPLIAPAAPLLRLFGVSGKLARQNAVRNPRRTAATASALMIGLTLITGLTVVGEQRAAGHRQDGDRRAQGRLHGLDGRRQPLSPDVAQKLGRRRRGHRHQPAAQRAAAGSTATPST